MQDAEDIRIKVLGKKGQLTEILRSMGAVWRQRREKSSAWRPTKCAQTSKVFWMRHFPS